MSPDNRAIACENSTALLEEKLINLEIKCSFLEDLIDTLNQTVYRQQNQIDALILELRNLRQDIRDNDQPQAFRSLRDDIPPHY